MFDREKNGLFGRFRLFSSFGKGEQMEVLCPNCKLPFYADVGSFARLRLFSSVLVISCPACYHRFLTSPESEKLKKELIRLGRRRRKKQKKT